jgi:hypothetical protein
MATADSRAAVFRRRRLPQIKKHLSDNDDCARGSTSDYWLYGNLVRPSAAGTPATPG